MSNFSDIPSGSIIQNRYRILDKLGQGGFGRTYLAENINQSNELCVLKEFAPQNQNPEQLSKAKELFQREVNALCMKLNHPQIPKFREMLKANFQGNDILFLVQDYVKGKTYHHQLFDEGKKLSESQATQLLLQLLPVLEYIHSQNVIHRDISPDNLIQRHGDEMPFLIDFGCVKEKANTSIYQSNKQGTVVGKHGYSPEEQLRDGTVYFNSDLYALAATVLVLIAGKKPSELYDRSNATWRWREIGVSPTLGTVLDKMLAHRPNTRYQSATEVRQALENPNPNNGSRMGSLLSRMSTIVLAPWHNLNSQISRFHNFRQIRMPKAIAIALGISLLTGIAAFAVVKSGLWQPGTLLGGEEVDRQKDIYQRIEDLKIDEAAFYQKVDELFYEQSPVKDRPLTENPEDAVLREQWYRIAEELLDRIERGEESF